MFDQINKIDLYYLATCYRPYPSGIHNAQIVAAKLAGHLINQGYKVFSPIVHTHDVALYGQIDAHNDEPWYSLNVAFLDKCDGMIVAKMDNWKASKGIAFEIDYMSKKNKPIYYWELDGAY